MQCLKKHINNIQMKQFSFSPMYHLYIVYKQYTNDTFFIFTNVSFVYCLYACSNIALIYFHVYRPCS